MKFATPVLLVLVSAVAGCAGQAPYVLKPYQFNRELEYFPDGPPVTDGSSVTVCYAKSSATPGQIRALADEACAGAGLNAVFMEQKLNACPLLTPIAANFTCSGAVASHSGAPSPGAATAPAQSLFEAPKPAGLGRSFGAIGAGDVSTTAKSQPFPTYLFNNPQQSR